MRRKTVKTLSMILMAIILTAVLCSCTGDETSSEPEDAQSAVTADNSVDESGADIASGVDSSDVTTSAGNSSSKSSSSGEKNTSSKTATGRQDTPSKDTATNSAGKKVTLYVKDFGAKGDGVTDDGDAIFKSISELRSSPEGSVLEFEKGKTYYYENNETNIGSKYILPYLFYFNGDSNLTVNGNGCLVKMGGYLNTFAKMEDCDNITIRDFNLDYAVKPAFAGELIGEITIDSSTKTATALVKADRDITLQNGEIYTSPRREMFGAIPSPTATYHLWIRKYEMVDTDSHTVRVYFDSSKGNALCYSDTTLIKKYGLILPMPHMGFSLETGVTDASFNIPYNSNLTFKNINVYSNKYQTFFLKECTGTFTFDNVNFVRAPYDQDLHFSSWGDIYHPTHNRAKLIFKNCTNEHPFDDVFNIVGVTLYVTGKNSNSDITLAAVDSWYQVPQVKVGDELTIINKSTGALIGRPKVKRVVKQDINNVRVTLDRSLPSLTTGSDVLVWDEDTVCDPESEMTGCNMDGTFRARTNMTFTNCKFNIRRFWIDLEAPWEGPLPRNMVFRGCTFTGDPGVVWSISSFNNVNKNGYRVENIVFENCTGISMDKISKGRYDEITIDGTVFR